LAVPPVERILTDMSFRVLANATMLVLSDTLINAVLILQRELSKRGLQIIS